MALLAIRSVVGAQEWKAAELMKGGYILNQPGVRSMASATIHPYGLLVDIRMAGSAFSGSL